MEHTAVVKIHKQILPVTLCVHRISLSQLGHMSETKRRRQVDLDIKCLQVLRAIIYNQLVQIDPELKERDPEKYRE